ncbi:hypothetical protein Psta_1086 [Pirellula staleyi DSM 6068]|uniref:Flp/Fap pilin component n=1 Tax=Pirellula staleyi (strain ATCC 27377 / DSM 6068 / ICPB 4128) TaxID=530564 RepID=D2R8F2_PIRSD|nr:hypothetical protein [Pirellula staleyi]ADB15769.1 hypothetical protein Psta_1086 [Pirellula staleyi DSM 6068]
MHKQLLQQMWNDESGMLAYEWTLLLTVLVIGIVTGVAAARDAIIDELGDAAEAMLALDDSYTIDYPLGFVIDGDSTGAASDSGFTDNIVYSDCGRATGAPQQVVNSNSPN